MASTILVKDVIWRIAVLLQDTTPQFQRWPEREIVHWLNDAQVAITKYLPAACSRVDAVKLKTGTRQSIEAIAAADCKPGDGSTPTEAIYGTQLLTLMRNMGADGLTPGAVIRPVDRHTLDMGDDLWHTRVGTVVRSFMFDERTPRYFWVTPGVQNGQNVWVETAFTAQPTSIPNTATSGAEAYLASGASTTKISIADEFVDDLVNYVCARAFMKDSKNQDPAKANKHETLFVNSLNAKASALTGNSPNLQSLPGVTGAA